MTCPVASSPPCARSSQSAASVISSFCRLVQPGSAANPSTVEIDSTTLAIGSLFISARFSTLTARRIAGLSAPDASGFGHASSRARTKSSALARTVAFAGPRRTKRVFPSSGRTRIPWMSGPRRASGSRAPLPRKTSGLTQERVRSCPGSPASTPTLAHSPARWTARRSSSPKVLASSSVSNPRHSASNHDASESGCDLLSDLIVTSRPASDAVRATSCVASAVPTRSFNQRR